MSVDRERYRGAAQQDIVRPRELAEYNYVDNLLWTMRHVGPDWEQAIEEYYDEENQPFPKKIGNGRLVVYLPGRGFRDDNYASMPDLFDPVYYLCIQRGIPYPPQRVPKDFLRDCGFRVKNTGVYNNLNFAASYEAIYRRVARLSKEELEEDEKVVFMGHSIGGTMARLLATEKALQGKVSHVITVGSPIRGSINGEKFDASGDLAEDISVTAFYSIDDPIVQPQFARIKGATAVRGSHMGLPWNGQVLDGTVKALTPKPADETPSPYKLSA
jgi:pimeloyl-ACP methyl ester carboxylesterase